MLVEDYAKTYETKTDDELLRLSLTSEELIPEAAIALSNELSRRNINTPEKLNTFRGEEKQREIEEEHEEFRRKGVSFLGFDQSRWGKADYVYNAETKIESFKTTYFVTVLGLPVIPTGTFLVRRKKKFWWADPRMVKKLPLDWEQVLRVWIAAASVLTALVWAFKLWAR